ncbi:MAG: response regulator, partial [bacterium]|nr:response regulator [bacterium]
IHEDAGGALWIGTGAGLSRMKNGKLTSITTKEGLFHDRIFTILEGNNGYFWMSCNKGIFRVSKKELNDFCDGGRKNIQCQSFDEKDGMKSRECNGGFQPAGWKSTDGKLWFPTMKGLVMIDPNKIDTNRLPPPVKVEAITVDNKKIQAPFSQPGETLVFSPGKDKFEIKYTGLSLMVPERVRFKYKLDGYESQWQEVGKRRTAYYTNLPPGDYTFRVNACNNDGVWNETGASLSFYLEPWFYQTTWFYSLCILAILLIAFTGYRLRVRQLKAREKELSQMVASRTRQLAEQSEKLKEMDQIKSRFFANISHEFRTPLTLIIGPLEQMIATWPGEMPKKKRKLTLMHRNAQRLLRLINQLLELSKLDSGKMILEARETNIISFVKGIAASFRLLAEQKELDLRFQFRPEESGNETGTRGIFLWVDHRKMEAVLSNLLVNAFKFTPPGGEIIITLSTNPVRDTDFPTGSADISVCDTGPGIPMEQIPYIFDRFYQADGTYEHHQKGSGIGLALSRALVELHHGTIEAGNRENKGSEFTLRLPMGNAHLQPNEMPGAPVSAKGVPDAVKDALTDVNISGDIHEIEMAREQEEAIPETQLGLEAGAGVEEKNIVLVVEDSADLREYIKEAIEPFYTAIGAPDGREGIQRAREIIPDLIVSDIMMPNVDGYELCKTLKNDVKTSHIPIILLTAKASEANIIQGLETGADDYITKPFSTSILNARIKNLIDVRSKLQTNINREMTRQPDKSSVSKIDREFLKELHDLISKNLSDENFNVEQLSKKLYMSRGHLHRKIAALSGITPTEFIRTYRLKRGAELLEQNFGTVLEVALEVGFTNSSYFSKCFKDKFHQLPSEYQDTCQT